MKNFLFLVFVSTCFLRTNAQNIKNAGKIPSTYNRSAITLFFLDIPGVNHSEQIKNKIHQLSFSEKYYNNNFSNLSIRAPYSLANANHITFITKYLQEKKIAKEIVSKWYSRKADGTMSMALIHQRGMFNATDAAFLKAEATKRGNAVLQDYGSRLINRSYILVLDFQKVKSASEAGDRETKGWQATVTGYLFKIDYDTNTQNKIYNDWINDSDTPEVRAEKNARYEMINIPVSFVTSVTSNVSDEQAIKRSAIATLLSPDENDDQLMMDIVQDGYNDILYSLTKKYEDFRVKTTIEQTHPLRAKIGKKEGVKTDNRYFAYEYVYNEKTNTTKQRYRGVVRATAQIVDNKEIATGNMGTTKFYQTAGKRLKTGYLLQQRNDAGIEISIGYGIGNIPSVTGFDGVNGYSARVDYRLGRLLGVRSFFLFAEGGLESRDYDLGVNLDGTSSFHNIVFIRYSYGIAKGMQISRNLELRLSLGLGAEGADHSDWQGTNFNSGISSAFYMGGLMLSKNLTRGIQIFGNVTYYYFTGKVTNGDKDDITYAASGNPVKWTDIFPNRDKPSIDVGLKFGF